MSNVITEKVEVGDLKFLNFDDIKVSTKTFIVNTNISLNIDKIHFIYNCKFATNTTVTIHIIINYK